MGEAGLGSIWRQTALFFCRIRSSARPAERSDQNRFLGQNPARLFLRLDEGEEIGVDLIGMGGGHPVRQAGIGFQGSVLQEFD
jgi:hypothetical protein